MESFRPKRVLVNIIKSFDASSQKWLVRGTWAMAIASIIFGILAFWVAKQNLNATKNAIEIDIEAKTRPFLSPMTTDSIRHDSTDRNDGVLRYTVTNSGASPAYAVRTWYGGAVQRPTGQVIVDWDDSTSFNVINPNASAIYPTVIKSFFSQPIPSYWPFVLTYEYRIPRLASEGALKEDFEVITYIYASTLVKTRAGLGTLSADEMRIRGRVDSVRINFRHPVYEIEWCVLSESQ